MQINRRSVAVMLGLGLLAAGLGVFASVPRAQGRRPAPLRLARAAEWGVWKMHAGHVTSLAEMAAELPVFVHRGRPGRVTPPGRPPRIRRDPIMVFKPVIYLYSDQSCRPIPVSVRVRMPVGGESLYYPDARASRRGLRFTGRLHATQPSEGCTETPRAFTQVHGRDHFWNAMRRVPAGVFETSSEAERFIFYDGLTDLRTPFVFEGADGEVSVRTRAHRHPQANVEDVVFAVDARRYRRVVVPPQGSALLTAGPEHSVDMLEAELRTELLARGLTGAEAQSLVATWHYELVQARGDRRIFFVDRADYDVMLPIRITPSPRQLVRVGLVIEQP